MAGLGRRVVVVAGLGRRVVAVAGSVVVGRRVVVVGITVTIEVTIEVTVTVRGGCSSWLALPTAAPSRNPATPSTQPRRHHGGRPLGGCPGGGAPHPPGGSCPQPLAGGIGSVGRSISTPRSFRAAERAYSPMERFWLRLVTRAPQMLDLPRVRWSAGAVEADVVAAQGGCVVRFAVLPPFPTVGHDAWRSASILDVCFGVLNSGRSRALGDRHVAARKHPIAGRVTPARQPVACG